MKNKLNIVWAIGQILIGIFIFWISLRELGLIKLAGMVGSILWIISQVMYIMKVWRR